MKNNFDADKYYEMNLLARCAHLYFRKDKSQQEISKILGLTRSKVSRYMKRILNEGLVKISFNFPELPELAARLCNEYGLRDAVVVPTSQYDSDKQDDNFSKRDYLKADIGQAAARYFGRVVGNGARIGISCGMTLYEMVRQIREASVKDIKIYPLAADSSYESVDISPNTLVGMLVAKLRPNAIGYALPAQITDDSSVVLKRKGKKLPSKIEDILSEAGEVDIAFIGIGAIKKGVPGFCMIAEQYNWSCEEIREQTSAVADYNYSLIDFEGKTLTEETELNANEKFQEITNRIISIPLETIQKLALQHGKLIVCLAGGKEKVAGIRAVLKGNLANVLITDFDTASKLLETE